MLRGRQEALQLDSEKENQNTVTDKMSDEELLKLTLKPLADPVIEAIFTSEDVAGLAAQSLVNAVLEIDGDPLMGKITRLTTQKTVSNILSRGYRLDIEGLSEKFIERVLSDLKNKQYDPKTPRLHYWLWALCESQTNGISLTEVIQMSEALQEFLKTDVGFEQYADRYEEVSSDLAVRRQFAAWTAEKDKLDIMRAVGRAEGRVEGIQEKAILSAKRMLAKGISPEITADCQDLPLSQVQDLLSQISVEES